MLRSHESSVLQYSATRGYRPLIDQVIQELATRGLPTTPDELIITAGSQQGLDLACRVLADPGDVAFVELPTYSGAIAAFGNLGVTLAGVAQDSAGLSVPALRKAAAQTRREGRRARFIYVTPNFQNPAGLLMAPARRLELLEAARELDLFIIEDDPYGSLYFEDRTTAARHPGDQGRRPRGLSGELLENFGAGFRVAWLCAAPVIAQHAELAKQATDLCTGVFDQPIVHLALARGIVQALAPRLRALYQDKCAVMEGALRDQLGDRVAWTSPRGGFFSGHSSRATSTISVCSIAPWPTVSALSSAAPFLSMAQGGAWRACRFPRRHPRRSSKA